MRNSVRSALGCAVLLTALCSTGFAQSSSQQSPGGSARQSFIAGQNAQAQQDYYTAIQNYLDAVGRNPAYLDAVVGLAQSYYALNQFDSALLYAEKARALSRNDASVMNLQARILLGLGNVQDARNLYQQVLALEPYNIEARLGQAELNVAEGNISGAVSLYQDAIRLDPQNRKALLSLALIYRAQGKDDVAGSYIQLALQYHSDNALVHLMAGEYYLAQSKFDQAQTQARTALAILSDYPDALILLAEIYLRTGENTKAAAAADQVIGNARSSAGASSRQSGSTVLTAWYLKGLADSRAGQSADAINAFQNLLTLDPGDEIARLALESEVRSYLPVESPDRAKYAAYHIQQAKELQSQDLYQEAQFQYRQALRVDPYNRDARLAYADLFRLQGYRAKYVAELQVLESLGIKDTQISDLLETYQSLLTDSVASNWNIAQFDVQRDLTTLSIYQIPAAQTLTHYESAPYFESFLKDQLLAYPLLDIPADPKSVARFADAFAAARGAGSDYFVLLAADEGDRSVKLTATLYLGRNGAPVQTYTVYRTGASRVEKATAELASEIQATLPVRGRLIARKFGTGVIDLGAMNGFKKDDQFVIVQQGNLTISSDGKSFVYPPDSAVGDFKITTADDQIAEGTVARRGFSDIIAVGDSIVPAPKPASANGTGSTTASASTSTRNGSATTSGSAQQPTPVLFPPLFQRLRALQ